MENQEETIKKRKDKIKGWFKDPYNLTFFAIILFAIAIRFYYFWLTKNQPIWWDESEYMSAAKSFLGIVNYQVGGQRLPGFPALVALFFAIGIKNEAVLRFFLCFIPSLLVIFLTYFTLKKMYADKKIALISTAIITVLWEHLFYSNRFHTENLALFFELLAIAVLFCCYLKKQNLFFIKAKYSLIWVILFCIASFIIRPGNLIFIPAVFVFILILNIPLLFGSKKKSIITLLVFLALIIILIFILSNISRFPMFGSYYHPQDPISWSNLTVFYGFYESLVSGIPSLLFYFFLIGLILFCLDLYLLYPRLKKINRNSEDLEFKSDIFNILLILSVLFFFIFMIRPASYEFRWFFPLLLGMLAFTSKGIIKSSEFIESLFKIKNLSVFLIIIIVLIGAYTQYYHADQVIKSKLDSYSQVRDAALWIKNNYPKNTQVLSISYPQTVYYSERNVSTYSLIKNSSEFNKYLASNKPEILEVSIFETHPEWINSWINDNKNRLTPINAYFIDRQKTQPVLVLYKIEYNNTSKSA